MSDIGQVVFAAGLFLVSAVCIFFARAVQGFAVATARFGFIRTFAKSASYLLVVRIVGTGFFVMGAIVLWLAFWGPPD